MMWVQTAVDALSLGGLYALAALGVAVVFGVMRLINFAHGELIMAGGYTMVALSDVPWPVMVIGTIVVTTVLALLIERVAFRPMRRASAATLLITSFTVSYLLQSLANSVLSATARPVLLPNFVIEVVDIHGIRVQKLSVITIALTILAIAALVLLLKKTTIGLQMRAAAEDFRMARFLGIRANRVIAAAFAISGILAGVVALIFIAQTGTVVPTVGVSITLVAFIGTVVGGMGDVAAATAGGFLLGVATVVLQVVLPVSVSNYRDAVVLVLVIALLIFRPRGLLIRPGAREAT
jgi:branched-chain amino acid transport system permease protein